MSLAINKIMSVIQLRYLKTSLANKVIRNIRYYSQHKHPFRRTLDVLSQDIPFFGSNKKFFVEHTDVVIIGGGIIGSMIAYWLKTRAGQGLSVTVLEKDPKYKKSHNIVSLGGMNQHFSLPENVLLSQYGAEFYRNIKQNLNSNVNIKYSPNGYLVLASEKYAKKLESNVTMQRELGVKNELLTPESIKKRYPWINTEDVALGCIGSESEGTFDARVVLNALVQRCTEMGTIYVHAEATGFQLELQRDVMMEGVAPGSFKKINTVKYRTSDGEENDIKFAACILAAGGDSGQIARLANIGTGSGLLSIPLPIDHRKHHVYTLEGNSQIGINTPLLQDSSGLWMRRNGLQNEILCGHLPLSSVEVGPEYEYFNEIIQPPLVNRVPTLNKAEIKRVDTEYIDYNSYDETGILGPHPYHNNLYIAAGFGSLGFQHAPGIGRAITELIIDSRYMNIDFTRFGFDRLLTERPMVELNVY